MILTNRANSSDKSLMMAVSCETNLHALEPILHAHVTCTIGTALSTGSVVVFEEMKTSNDSFVIKVLNPIQCSYPIFHQKLFYLSTVPVLCIFLRSPSLNGTAYYSQI